MLRVYFTQSIYSKKREELEKLLSFLYRNKILYKTIRVVSKTNTLTYNKDIITFSQLQNVLQMTNIVERNLPISVYYPENEEGNVLLGNVDKTIEYFKKRGFCE